MEIDLVIENKINLQTIGYSSLHFTLSKMMTITTYLSLEITYFWSRRLLHIYKPSGKVHTRPMF